MTTVLHPHYIEGDFGIQEGEMMHQRVPRPLALRARCPHATRQAPMTTHPPGRWAKVPGDHRGPLYNYWVWCFPAWSGSWLFVKPNRRTKSAVSAFELFELYPKWACMVDTRCSWGRATWMWSSLPCHCQPAPPPFLAGQAPRAGTLTQPRFFFLENTIFPGF